MQDLDALYMIDGVVGGPVNPFDRGLAYGDGLFETMRLWSGQIPLLHLHLNRLYVSCQRLDIPINLVEVEHQLTDFLKLLRLRSFGDGVIKLVFTRGVGGAGYYPPSLSVCKPTCLIMFTPTLFPSAFAPVALRTLRHALTKNQALAGIKHLNRLDYVMAAAEIGVQEGIHGLLLDTDGLVVESVHHNIFIWKSGQLLTPNMLSAGVMGIMRNLIVERIAPELGVGAIECELRLEDLWSADEVFICNSVRGISPVIAVDDHSWHAYPKTKRLSDALTSRWPAYAS